MPDAHVAMPLFPRQWAGRALSEYDGSSSDNDYCQRREERWDPDGMAGVDGWDYPFFLAGFIFICLPAGVLLACLLLPFTLRSAAHLP